jgi:intracellular septation protein
MMWISLVIIVVFGGATLALHDETFIKWKPTVLYWLFGAVIAVAQSLFRRNLVRAMLGEQVRMPDGVWTRLNWSWVGFFTFMGAANLLVAYNFPTDTWVNFKLFGGMGLMLVFVVLQALFLARHVEEKDASGRIGPARRPRGSKSRREPLSPDHCLTPFLRQGPNHAAPDDL